MLNQILEQAGAGHDQIVAAVGEAGIGKSRLINEFIQSYRTACTDVIKRYDGHVAQLLGDGLLSDFGYPQAHEDDAQRAIHGADGRQEQLALGRPRTWRREYRGLPDLIRL